MTPADTAPPSIRVFADMAGAAADWDRAERDCVHWAFQTRAWLEAWQATLGAAEGMRPCPVLVEQAGAVLMLLPFGIARRRGLRVLGFLGGIVTDYHAPLLAPDWAARLGPGGFAALWPRILAALPPLDLVAFERMPATVAGVPNPFATLPGVEEGEPGLSLRLPGNLEAFRKTQRSGFAADTRRKRRRLSEIGPISYHRAADEAEVIAALAAMAERKSRRWLDTGNPDAFARPAFRAFYEAMSRRAPGDGAIHASLLRVGDAVVAAHWGLIHRGRLYYLMIGWSAGEWSRHSVGRIMIEEMIAEAIAEGLEVFDLTVGDEAYKLDWANERLPMLSLHVPRTGRGRAALALRATLDALRARAKRVGWLRAAVRRLTGRKPAGG